MHQAGFERRINQGLLHGGCMRQQRDIAVETPVKRIMFQEIVEQALVEL
jgi:hypothetical protein